MGDNGKGELAWTYMVRSKDRKDRFARQYWVAAQGARILLKEDLVYMCGGQQPPAAAAPAPATAMATASATKGKVIGNIYEYKKSPLDPPDKDQPLQDYIAESVNGTQIVTDSSGQYGPVPAPLNTSLIGPFARVINDGSGGALVPKQDGNNLRFDATTEAELAQVRAFYWVNYAHEFVSRSCRGR